MELTVCICTHNRPHYLRECLEGLGRQTAPAESYAVLVVDSASTGEPRAALQRLVASVPGVELLRLEQAGISAARNAGAWAARSPYVAYLDDDAIPAPDWVGSILAAISERPRAPALIGGRILPCWQAPLPNWWPPSLRGVLSIIEVEGRGEYRSADLPPGLEPYGANMVVHVLSLLAAGGFADTSGRVGLLLRSDEEVQLAWRLQEAGHSVRYDSRIVVQHQIQSERLTPAWLLSRLYWQGVSTVQTRRVLHHPGSVWRALPRRLIVALLCAPTALLPRHSTWLLACRWRLAYALGFISAAFGCTAIGPHRRQRIAPRLRAASLATADPQ